MLALLRSWRRQRTCCTTSSARPLRVCRCFSKLEVQVSDVIKVGVVAYDPKIVTIWERIKEYFTTHSIAMDFILFSNYDTQCDALLNRWIDIAWNTNLTYVKIYRR